MKERRRKLRVDGAVSAYHCSRGLQLLRARRPRFPQREEVSLAPKHTHTRDLVGLPVPSGASARRPRLARVGAHVAPRPAERRRLEALRKQPVAEGEHLARRRM
jgi:hypothetical protein